MIVVGTLWFLLLGNLFLACQSLYTNKVRGLMLPKEVVSLSHLTTVTPNMFYISFGEALDPSQLAPKTIQELTIVHLGDDFPYQKIELPFEFNYFGVDLENIYVSPNGAIMTAPYQACPQCNCFLTPSSIEYSCTFDNSYFGVIAGLLNDLFPGKYPKHCNVTASIDASSVTVAFTNVPYFSSSANNTFYMTIEADSSVTLAWEMIGAAPRNIPWLVGLRAPRDTSHVEFTAQQLTIGSSIWGTTAPGVYPSSRAQVAAGNAFTACPISTVWCASPAVLDPSNLVVVVRPMSFSCAVKIEVVAYVAHSSVSSIVVNLTSSSHSIADCIASTGAKYPNNTLTCDLKSIPSSYLAPSSNFMLSFAWRVAGSKSDFTALSLVKSLNLAILSAGGSSPTASCVLNNNSSMNRCLTNPGDACSICSGNYSCLDLPCDGPSQPVLYKYPVCNNTCYANISPFDMYFDSENNQCCQEDTVDCNGVCGGLGVVSVNTAGYSTCCPSVELLDCMGVCNGKTQYDACGVCGGHDLTGKGCDTGISVFTGSGEPNFLYANINLASSTSASVYVNVSNSNSSAVNASLSFASSSSIVKYAPSIRFLSPTHRLIPGNSWYRFSASVSLNGLLTGAQSGWIVKDLVLVVERESPFREVRYTISVYPAAYNCSVLSSTPNACMVMPACINCFVFDGPRLLESKLEIDEFIEDNAVLGDATEHDRITLLEGIQKKWEYINRMQSIDSSNRRQLSSESLIPRERVLYPNILPDILQSGGPVKSGECTEGWGNEDCALAFSNGSSRGSTFSIFGWSLVLHCAVLALMLA